MDLFRDSDHIFKLLAFDSCNFRGTEFRFGTLQESLVPVLRIQVDLKCTGNFIFTSLVDGGRHADLIFGPPAGV